MSAERNLVDVVDDVLALYGPLLAGLLRYPDANGIRTFIGRDEPTALLMGEDMRGYRDDAFEFLARESLLPLVEATSEIQESCPAIRRIHEPLSVHIVRGEDGIAHVTAGVHDGLGSVFVHRQAAAFERWRTTHGQAARHRALLGDLRRWNRRLSGRPDRGRF